MTGRRVVGREIDGDYVSDVAAEETTKEGNETEIAFAKNVIRQVSCRHSLFNDFENDISISCCIEFLPILRSFMRSLLTKV